jgi:RNA polymerase sigma-70 factor (ECF subfamily)
MTFVAGLDGPRWPVNVLVPRHQQHGLIDLLRLLFSRSNTVATAPTAGPDPDAPRPAPFAIDLDNTDIDALITEHADAAYRVAFSITRNAHMAQDVTQDSLFKAWQKLPTFRGEAPLRNWILRITHNTAISALRRKRAEPRDPATLPEKAVPGTVERTVGAHMAMEEFATALDGLDELSRSIIVLREVEGLSYDEIVDLLEIPLPTVKTRLLRARRQLANTLRDWQP